MAYTTHSIYGTFKVCRIPRAHNIRSKNVMKEVFQIKKLRGQKFPKTMMTYSIGKSGVEV